ncbi:hypothetical protein AVEN_20081-1 [Araneus ventricosus]|uniref:Uncharacterized protein n=1 Tax=Araneus ventricosus TaxID=182803 RepID=A0A4Y2UMV4_ARAVE|nr:hypothetical protein AVEN_24027-1 [Araneus ventricosus]GBO13340.1 hypothetical protein AVEN_145168-1 [Araneus ventricosus]GBO13365.1 hypothetical protein AVEN_131377-1 [Araneus ventricosus]GBO14198.1 hypothetical protein AVEN_20081-1 [Araneus ventricosus]
MEAVPWCLLLLLCLGWALADQDDQIELEEPMHARQAWIRADQRLRSATNKIMRKALPAIMKEVYKKDLSTTCLTTLLHTANALKQNKAWAFKSKSFPLVPKIKHFTTVYRSAVRKCYF